MPGTRTKHKQSSLLNSALWYGKRGWPVIALHHIEDDRCSCGKSKGKCKPGKHPRWHPDDLPHGLKNATTDLDLIRRWWQRWPSANIAICTGPESGLFMIGPDGQAGLDALAELEQHLGELPRTPRAKSGSGGKHYLFRWPSGGGISNADKHRDVPIDLRGAGGYFVAAPSQNKNGPYEWEINPAECEVAEAPAAWLDWCRTKKKTCFQVNAANLAATQERAVKYLGKMEPAISGQGGHKRTMYAARVVVYGFDLGPEIGLRILQQHYNPLCQPKWSEEELRHKCADADTKPFGEPRGWLLADYRPAGDRLAAETAEPVCEAPPWPAPLAREAYHGLAGDAVRVLEPASEADPSALLFQVLVLFGNLIGRKPYFIAEADRHYPNEYLVLIGRTSKGRKGSSWGQSRRPFFGLDEEWIAQRTQSGLSSGEGLIWAVRDEIWKREKQRGGGYADVQADPGVSDKRLMIFEPEFATVLKQPERTGNTLSTILRQAWDSGDLSTLVKNNPARATAAHISIVGHITEEELTRYLSETEMANGWANRILWNCAERSKALPEGGTLDEAALADVGRRMALAVANAGQGGLMRRDEEARELWRAVYGELSEGQPGLTGAMLGRAEAHVMRLAMLYALLDCSPAIRAEHLTSGLACWQRVEESVRYVFGDDLGDPLADDLLHLLRGCPAGLTRTDIMHYLGRNQSSDRIGRALGLLLKHQLTRRVEEQTGGRPSERWFAGGGA
jgi:hypothetical protein